MAQWQNFWAIPAVIAGVILVVFALFFKNSTPAIADTTNG
jgi:hypothetical protein